MRIVVRPVLKSADSIVAACREANAADACVGVIAWMHTFSPARMWIAGLQALQVPLLHLHTQFNRDLPWGEIDMDYMNLHQAAHGDREFGFIETRLGVARKTVVGHWQDPDVQSRIGTWTRAACAWREAHHLRVARFGDNMRNVADTEGDKVEAQIRLGVSVNGYAMSDLAGAIDAAPRTRGRRTPRDLRRGLRRRARPRSGRRPSPGASRGGPDRGRAAGLPRPTAGSERSPIRSKTSGG